MTTAMVATASTVMTAAAMVAATSTVDVSPASVMTTSTMMISTMEMAMIMTMIMMFMVVVVIMMMIMVIVMAMITAVPSTIPPNVIPVRGQRPWMVHHLWIIDRLVDHRLRIACQFFQIRRQFQILECVGIRRSANWCGCHRGRGVRDLGSCFRTTCHVEHPNYISSRHCLEYTVKGLNFVFSTYAESNIDFIQF